MHRTAFSLLHRQRQVDVLWPILLLLVLGGAMLSFVPAARAAVTLELVASGFDSPVHLESPGDGSGRIAIVDRTGTIYMAGRDGTMGKRPFLDVRAGMVSLSSSYDERGLLGLAFHPDFAENGKLYVYYSVPLRAGATRGWDHTSRISEFTVSPITAHEVDPKSERIILEIDQPQGNHNGGALAFGPDGYLYIGLGDGGSGNDVGVGHPPLGNGQDVTTLLGSILRIDVDNEGPEGPYAIPADNPFAAGGGRAEIYAWGFRNPYRFSFDPGGAHRLFVADVGQNLWEEVNLVLEPGNFGWRIKEGTFWFDPARPNAVLTDGPRTGPRGEPLVDPVIQYRHPNVRTGQVTEAQQMAAFGISVIGGYVYRGEAIPEWQGHYVFGDWSTSFAVGEGKLLLATPAHPRLVDDEMISHDDLIGEPLWQVQSVLEVGEFVLGFGQDGEGEVYVLTTERTGPYGGTGKVYKIVPAH